MPTSQETGDVGHGWLACGEVKLDKRRLGGMTTTSDDDTATITLRCLDHRNTLNCTMLLNCFLHFRTSMPLLPRGQERRDVFYVYRRSGIMNS